MSKFGSDDGSNSNGPKRDQVSVDGFRLDSSQSSWLMDRLGALDEEDKMSLSSSAAQVQMPEVQMSDNSDDGTPPRQGQPSHLQPVRHQAPPHNQNSSDAQPPNQMNSKKAPVRPAHQTSQPIGQHAGADPQHNESQAGDIDSESALLLRQKIENLEQQIAEISDLTGEQRANYVEELSEPHGRGPVGPPHLRGGEIFDEDSSFADEAQDAYGVHPQGYEQQGYNPHASEQYQAPEEQSIYGTAHEGQAPYSQGENFIHEADADMIHGHDPLTMVPDYSDHPNQQGYEQITHQHEAYETRQGGVSPDLSHVQTPNPQMQQGGAQMQHGGQVQHAQHQHGGHQQGAHPQDYAELPQFLAPIQQEKKGRPAYLAVLGSIGALVVAGGIAYTYLNGGVSDVIKSDLTSVRLKEPSKLAESANRVDQPGEEKVEVAKAAPKVNLQQRFSVPTLEGMAGKNLPFQIQLPNDSRLSSAFLVVRNLPDWVKLNYGRQMNGLWMVSVSQANELEMIIPEDQPGKFSFEIDLVVNAGDAPVTKKVTANIAPYQAPKPKVIETPEVVTPAVEEKQKVASVEADTENSELIKQPGVGAQKGPLIIDQALEEKWLERGTRLLRAGDVSAARLAFSHLAEQGSGRAALAMGMTFDPNQPSARVLSGIKLDKKRARFWYQRALSLGHEGARDPLRQLDR